ncbi:hypothetical protein SAY86_003441 [Trapa natans]|uniref:RING-type domain-containing protein n=1 Tax=Trapa natans TaxID=22666 RepID=A0AAN7ME73_TRANT|nr:hypothetical protein SAY86_003441 [Trapa natans]
MGFPVGYTELLVPKLLFPIIFLFTLLRCLASSLSRSLRLPEIRPATNRTTYLSDFVFPCHSLSVALVREATPVTQFSALPDPEKPDRCAVCLYEFQAEDEVHLPTNCCHVFHRGCLDRWIGYDQRTCPLCRAALISGDMQDSINERLWGDAYLQNSINERLWDDEEPMPFDSDEMALRWR